MKRYTNAKNVFPKSVLNLLYGYFPGGLLWIPPYNAPNVKREEVIDFFTKGVSSSEIARKVRLSRRRVNQIIKEHKKRMEAEAANMGSSKTPVNEEKTQEQVL